MSKEIPLVRPSLPSLDEIANDLRRMLESGKLTNFGPYSRQLEREVADLLGARYVLAVSSCTTGLCLLLNTLPAGGEVIVPSFTFVATVQAIIWNGLTPVFADIEPDTMNVCPRSVKSCITSKTAAILAVHAFGAPCKIKELNRIAKEHGLMLFFDSAHAFGSRYQGQSIGSFGDGEVFSLSATKVMSSAEGGLLTTNNEGIYNAILDRRNYGLRRDGSKDCANRGLNGKLSEFSAILALKELESLSWRIQQRNEIAQHYVRRLHEVSGLRFQTIHPGDVSTFKDFTLRVDPTRFGTDRNDLRSQLANRAIETASYFWPAIHQMTYFQQYMRLGQDLLHTELAANRILSLPIFESLSDDDLDWVIKSVIIASCSDYS